MSGVSVRVCTHHWLLGKPGRGVIPAVCRICGSTRLYPARLEDTDRFFDHEELLLDAAPPPRHGLAIEEQLN